MPKITNIPLILKWLVGICLLILNLDCRAYTLIARGQSPPVEGAQSSSAEAARSSPVGTRSSSAEAARSSPVGTRSSSAESAQSSPIDGIQTYQKNIHLSEEHKQKLASDLNHYRSAENLWDVIRSEFALPHYEETPQVQQQIAWFLNHPDFLQNSTERAAHYLYFIHQQIKKKHLPSELILLPMIESAYNPFAYSSTGASGMWQMMPRTASGFGVKKDWWYDGRRDVVASTHAALRYLSYLGNYFEGNWLLAIAAYDTGEGNLLSALHKNIREGKSTDFWSLPLSQETREYVPRLLALASIIAHRETFRVSLPFIPDAPYLAQLDIDEQMDLKHAATLAGLSLKTLKQLNPGYNQFATTPDRPYKLILPLECVAEFSQNLANSSPNKTYTNDKTYTNGNAKFVANTTSSFAEAKPEKYIQTHHHLFSTAKNIPLKNAIQTTFKNLYALQPGDTLYMVRDNDSIEKIAKRFNIDTHYISSANTHLDLHQLSPGMQIIIPTHINQEEKLPANEKMYIVMRGDTVDSIAEKFQTSAAAIRVNNLLQKDIPLQAGDQLIIPLRKTV